MRRLLLIRHAKSSHKNPELDDHERPLNRRGERDVVSMARHLENKDEHLDVVYSSTAVRALDFAQTISEFTHVTLMPDLSFYTFSANDLLEVLQNLPEQAHCVAVVAHNPAVTQAANHLTGEMIENIPTAGIVAMDCDIEGWNQLGERSSTLDYFDYPKMFERR